MRKTETKEGERKEGGATEQHPPPSPRLAEKGAKRKADLVRDSKKINFLQNKIHIFRELRLNQKTNVFLSRPAGVVVGATKYLPQKAQSESEGPPLPQKKFFPTRRLPN